MSSSDEKSSTVQDALEYQLRNSKVEVLGFDLEVPHIEGSINQEKEDKLNLDSFMRVKKGIMP